MILRRLAWPCVLLGLFPPEPVAGRTCLDYRSVDPGTPPPLRAVLPLPGPVLDVASLPGHIYLACGPDGLRIVELSDPDAPLEVGHLAFAATPATRVAVYGCQAFVATGGAVERADITSADAPVALGRLAAGSPISDLDAADGRLVAATSGGDLVVWPVSPCGAPGPAARIAPGGIPRRVAVAGGYAFAATDTGLGVVDLADPVAPVLVSRLAAGSAIAAVAVWGDTVVAVGGLELTLWAPAGPEPALVRCVPLPSPGLDVAAAGSELHVLADSTWCVFAAAFHELRLPVGEGVLPGDASGIDLGGPGVFFAAGTAGVVEAWRQCAVDPPVAVPVAVNAVSLRAVPNPANPRVSIHLAGGRARAGTLSVHDLRGRRVATLHEGTLPQRPAAISWSGRDHTGRLVPSGRYVAVWRADSEHAAVSLTIVR